MSETPAAPYVVRGAWPGGRVRYRCPTAVSALGKLRDFARSGYADIAITGPDGTAMTEADLLRAQEREASGTVETADPDGGAPIDPGAARAPVLVP